MKKSPTVRAGSLSNIFQAAVAEAAEVQYPVEKTPKVTYAPSLSLLTLAMQSTETKKPEELSK